MATQSRALVSSRLRTLRRHFPAQAARLIRSRPAAQPADAGSARDLRLACALLWRPAQPGKARGGFRVAGPLQRDC